MIVPNFNTKLPELTDAELDLLLDDLAETVLDLWLADLKKQSHTFVIEND